MSCCRSHRQFRLCSGGHRRLFQPGRSLRLPCRKPSPRAFVRPYCDPIANCALRTFRCPRQSLPISSQYFLQARRHRSSFAGPIRSGEFLKLPRSRSRRRSRPRCCLSPIFRRSLDHFRYRWQTRNTGRLDPIHSELGRPSHPQIRATAIRRAGKPGMVPDRAQALRTATLLLGAAPPRMPDRRPTLDKARALRTATLLPGTEAPHTTGRSLARVRMPGPMRSMRLRSSGFTWRRMASSAWSSSALRLRINIQRPSASGAEGSFTRCTCTWGQAKRGSFNIPCRLLFRLLRMAAALGRKRPGRSISFDLGSMRLTTHRTL